MSISIRPTIAFSIFLEDPIKYMPAFPTGQLTSLTVPVPILTTSVINSATMDPAAALQANTGTMTCRSVSTAATPASLATRPQSVRAAILPPDTYSNSLAILSTASMNRTQL